MRRSGEEDVPWIIRVANLVKGVNQGTLLVGLSAMWSLIIDPAVVLPKLSQLTGTELQVCSTNISSQCMAAVAKSAAIRKDSAKSQWCNMRTANQYPLAANVLHYMRFRWLEVYLSSGVRLRTWLACWLRCRAYMWHFIVDSRFCLAPGFDLTEIGKGGTRTGP